MIAVELLLHLRLHVLIVSTDLIMIAFIYMTFFPNKRMISTPFSTDNTYMFA